MLSLWKKFVTTLLDLVLMATLQGRLWLKNTHFFFNQQGCNIIIEVIKVFSSSDIDWVDTSTGCEVNRLSGTCDRIWRTLELLLYSGCCQGKWDSCTWIFKVCILLFKHLSKTERCSKLLVNKKNFFFISQLKTFRLVYS